MAALYFGIRTRPFHHGNLKTRWNNLCGGLAIRLTGRSRRTYELTSSIVPRGTSFHRGVEFACSPIRFLLCGLSRCDSVPGPVERGAVNPDAVHDSIGQSAGQLPSITFVPLFPPVPGDLHRAMRQDLVADVTHFGGVAGFPPASKPLRRFGARASRIWAAS